MSDLFEYDDAATPLTPDERNGLIPTHITMRSELNEIEQKNILDADNWVFQRKRNALDEGFLRRLHKRMFGEVWSWAGTYRTTDRNIGVAPWRIQTDLKQLLDDVYFWIENKTYVPDEIAIRFHHRLVAIHPFPNGNGRWSRLVADILAVTLSQPRFTWGQFNLQTVSEVRRRYIDALRKADNHDISALIEFARKL
ncbi:MAG: mobile mystery protein B [Alphaproteobacteria bacterium]|nr:mobile mystery protein B [Alphaproteobacteria bacterium]